MRGEQFDGQVRFYEDRLREAELHHLARQAGQRRRGLSLTQGLYRVARHGVEGIVCSLPGVRRPAYCRVKA